MEKRDLYNEKKELLDKTIFKDDFIPDGYFILIVVVFIQNNNGKFLIQKRSELKGGEWAFTGGHPKSGQSSLEGIKEEVKEELGIIIDNPILFREAKGKNTFCDLYYIKQDFNLNDVVIQEDEVSEVMFATTEEIDELFNNGKFKKGHYMMFKDCLNYLGQSSNSNKENIVLEKDLKLLPLKKCINKDLYEMYQDIPKEEIGSLNKLNGVSYNEFKKICKDYIEEETSINKEINTTTNRYILYDKNKPIGEVGIRTTLNDFWMNKGSQIYYKIRKSERGKGYGNIILKLALEEAKKLGFKMVRINCDDNNIPSKKVIENNGGIIDIKSYKTNNVTSSSYIINLY